MEKEEESNRIKELFRAIARNVQNSEKGIVDIDEFMEARESGLVDRGSKGKS